MFHRFIPNLNGLFSRPANQINQAAIEDDDIEAQRQPLLAETTDTYGSTGSTHENPSNKVASPKTFEDVVVAQNILIAKLITLLTEKINHNRYWFAPVVGGAIGAAGTAVGFSRYFNKAVVPAKLALQATKATMLSLNALWHNKTFLNYPPTDPDQDPYNDWDWNFMQKIITNGTGNFTTCNQAFSDWDFVGGGNEISFNQLCTKAFFGNTPYPNFYQACSDIYDQFCDLYFYDYSDQFFSVDGSRYAAGMIIIGGIFMMTLLICMMNRKSREDDRLVDDVLSNEQLHMLKKVYDEIGKEYKFSDGRRIDTFHQQIDDQHPQPRTLRSVLDFLIGCRDRNNALFAAQASKQYCQRKAFVDIRDTPHNQTIPIVISFRNVVHKNNPVIERILYHADLLSDPEIITYFREQEKIDRPKLRKEWLEKQEQNEPIRAFLKMDNNVHNRHTDLYSFFKEDTTYRLRNKILQYVCPPQEPEIEIEEEKPSHGFSCGFGGV